MIDDFEKFYIGLAPQYNLQNCLDSKEDLGITRVSSSNRYNENLNPNFKDKVVDKPGEDGQYYFSSELNSTTHSINFSFDSINESQLRLLKQIQSSKKMWYLTYDNLPFKYYIVKPTGTSKISYVPFYENEQRVYKGEGTLEFICYEGYAHSWIENKDEFYSEPNSLEGKGITFSTNFEDYQVSSSASYSYYNFKLANKEVKIKTIEVESKISSGRDLTGEGIDHRFLIFNGKQTSPSGTNYKIISSSASNTAEMDVITSMSDGSFNIGFFPNKNKETSQSIINKIINNIIKIKFIDENGNLLNPIPSVPRERFENIDEWKDSCGFFDEKNYSYKEISMNFTKTIEGNSIKYISTITSDNGFFVDGAEKKIILKQNPVDIAIDSTLNGTIQLFPNNTNLNPIEIKVPGEIDTVKISFNPELRVMNVKYTGYDINFPNIDFDNFKKITWTIEGAKLNRHEIKYTEPIKPSGMIAIPYYIDETYFELPSTLVFKNSDNRYYCDGTLDFTLNVERFDKVNCVANIEFWKDNKQVDFNEQAYLTYDRGVQGTLISISTTFSLSNAILFSEKPNKIIINFRFSKLEPFVGNSKIIINLDLKPVYTDKKFLLSYISESNNVNKYFQLDDPNKKFLYTYYTNFGDKDTKPIISIKNLNNIYALGIYKTDTLESELYLTYTDFSLIFNILELNLSSDTFIDNDKCLILNEGKCYNQNIEYGDFFKISNEEDCFIYIVPLDDNLNPISFTNTPSAVIHPNYLFF